MAGGARFPAEDLTPDLRLFFHLPTAAKLIALDARLKELRPAMEG